jgi:CHAD domain-containing protein
MEEVDPHPDWAELRRVSRQLFRRLGALRDAHVLDEWMTRLTPADAAARTALLSRVRARIPVCRSRARRAAERFDRRGWARLARTLTRRARVVPPNSRAAQCLVLERLGDVEQLQRRVARTEQAELWHQWRVAIKRLRYGVEALFPARVPRWTAGLRQLQDLLGEIHDLDVLDRFVVTQTAGMAPGCGAALPQRIDAERRDRRERCHDVAAGPLRMLRVWSAGVSQGAGLDALAAARLAATAAALDPHPRRTARVSRLAQSLFEMREASGGRQRRDSDATTRATLAMAALVHGVRAPNRHGHRRRTASAILRDMPPPPGWTPERWQVLALVVRYHRGAEPKATHRRFAGLRPSRQRTVRLLAGVLRLARALDRCGARVSAQARGFGRVTPT